MESTVAEILRHMESNLVEAAKQDNLQQDDKFLFVLIQIAKELQSLRVLNKIDVQREEPMAESCGGCVREYRPSGRL